MTAKLTARRAEPARRPGRTLPALAAALAALAAVEAPAAAQTRPADRRADRKVLAFYYPWYGVPAGPGGAGKTVHWGRIDPARKDIEASTHYPALGAYDSHDPNVIDQHCRWAKAAGLDGFIVSWWGHGSYCDRAMPKVLDACGRHGLVACAYYEAVPKPQTPQTAANDVTKLLKRYGPHAAHLAVGGKPVVFIYSRAVGELGMRGWLEASRLVKRLCPKGAVLVGDQLTYASARVFDGLHTYNTCGQLRGKDAPAAGTWAADAYRRWVDLADRAGRISSLTLIPGYDDTKIRTPGLNVPRRETALYRAQWEQAIGADPDWVLITSFNEWHEGSEIEPSAEDGRQYLDLTARYAARFKAAPRRQRPRPKPAISAIEMARLRTKLKGLEIAVLPGADSTAFWWLTLEVGARVKDVTWADLAAGRLSAKRHPVLLYAAGERYRRSVRQTGDVDAALQRYLAGGGFLVAMPSLPMPFHYDESGQAVNRCGAFGLTLRMGWETPPAGAKLHFVRKSGALAHVPERLAFPAVGDPRWRPFVPAKGARTTALLELRDADNRHLGDAVAYAELPGGGRVLSVWFGLLQTTGAEGLLYDLFDIIAVGTRRDNP